MSLKKTAIAGFFWSFLERFGIQAILFLVSIVLARVLSPEEFGLIGMLTVFMAIGRTLIDSGLTQSLIRDGEVSDKDYSTVFFFNLAGSVLIYVIIYLCAPLISQFYRQPILEDITKVYCLSFVINAFSSVQLTKLSRELDFKTQMLVSIPSQLIAGIVGVSLAFLDFGVWSLVYMSLVQATLNTIQVWYRSGWTPVFVFDKARLRHHFNFGYKLGLASLLNTAFNNLYVLIIGRFFPVAEVGYFTRAANLKNLPVENLSFALNKVTYPLFSSIQKDETRLRHVYKQIMETVVFIIAPTLLLLSALSEPVVTFLLTDKWLPVVPYLQILCFGGILSPIHSYNLNILKVKGRSDLFLKLEIIKRVILVLTILISMQYGIMGLIWGQLIDSILFLFVNSYYSGKFINYSLQEQMLDLLPIIALAMAVGAIVYFVNLQLTAAGAADYLRILIAGPLGLALYLGTAGLFRMEAFIYIKNLFLKR